MGRPASRAPGRTPAERQRYTDGVRAARFLLLVTVSLLTLGAIEMALRTFAPQPLYAVQPCERGWCHVPGAAFIRGGETREFVARVRYNTHGLRHRETPIRKPPGVRRVLVFGDSLTEGLEVDAADLHTAHLERHLREALHPEIEVINFGVSAYDTAQEWRYFVTEGVQYAPDLVIVLWAGEWGSPFARLREDGGVAFIPARPARWTRDARAWLKRSLHIATLAVNGLGLGHTVRDVAPPSPIDPALQRALFAVFAQASRAAGAPLLVVALTEYGPLLAVLRDPPIPGLHVIDVARVMEPEDTWARDSHYTPRGHRKVARVLADAIILAGWLGLTR